MVPPSKRETRLSHPDPASATCQIQNEQMPQISHVTIALTSIFFPPMELALPNLLSQPLQESFAKQLVLWFSSRHWARLMCLKQLLVLKEPSFPNCTGTMCCRTHNNHSSQASFSFGWFTKNRCSRHSIYQFEQRWTFLLLFRQCLKNYGMADMLKHSMRPSPRSWMPSGQGACSPSKPKTLHQHK